MNARESGDQPTATLGSALELLRDQLTTGSVDNQVAGVPFRAVSFLDELTDVEDLTERVVLAPGLGLDEWAATARALGRRGAVAVVAKGLAAPDGSPAAPCLVTFRRDGDWAQLAGALRALARESGATEVVSAPAGDLFALANALASHVGAAVSLVDATGQVVGYSTHEDQPIDALRRRTTLLLREQVPIGEDPDYREVLRHDRAVHVDGQSGQYPRVARAVRASGELLGVVWVVVVDHAATAGITRLVEGLEPVVAQHFLRARGAVAEHDRRTGVLLRSVLEGQADAAAAARQLLLRRGSSYTVVCFGLQEWAEVASAPALFRLMKLAMSRASSTFTHSTSALIDGCVAVLVADASPATVQAFARSIVRTDPSLVAGIGPQAGLAEVPRAYRRAVATATWALTPAHPGDLDASDRAARFEDVRDGIAVRDAADLANAADAARDDAAFRLVQYDRDTGSQLAPTVLAYLRHHGSVRRVADALHLHQNTVRYRLQLVDQTLGIDLDEPSTRLWLWLRLEGIVTP